MSLTLPLGLKTAIESGNCVLFIGAGIGHNVTGNDGNEVPDAAKLAEELAKHFRIDTDSTDLSKVSQIVAIRRPRHELDEYLRKRLADAAPDEYVQWLTTNRWKAIYTTNYDYAIERAFELNGKPLQNPVSISATSEIVQVDPRIEVPIFHIHGALFGRNQEIVITQEDYTVFRERRRMLFEAMKLHFATSTILYIGYSNRDPNWSLVLQEISTEFAPAKLPISYRVSPGSDALDIEILKNRGIESISLKFQDFAIIAKNELSAAIVDPDQLRKLASQIPSDLLEAFHNSPAATLRLLTSWEYVNQAPFAEPPNVSAFLRGDAGNWALFGAKHCFARDIEEELFDDLLDYATATPKGPKGNVLIGPAGYGTSTVMKSTAVRLVTEKVGPVFFLRRGAEIIEGDIEYAASLFKEVPFFFVDDAAEHRHQASRALSVLRDGEIPALLVLAARRNEWQQMRTPFPGRQFPIESLSDAEINRLLDFLQNHKALNRLEPLSRELQFSAVKNKHGKELLVAMREATEDLGFDAILESEYRGINNDLSRRLYLTVCCIYQHGAYVRDTVLAKILNTPLPEFYKSIKDPTDGVVVFDCLDANNEIYGARARHRTIAQIVWERCGDPTTKEELLQALISELNLNFGSDAKAFEQLIRSDHLIDSIRDLDGKTRFFETACKKDPKSPYVRQHYSRMLLRSEKLELALSQIDQAFKLQTRPARILHHTKGMILKALAISSTSADVGRRYVARAEESFRQALALDRTDHYSYQSLAMLFLEWAKRAATDEEQTRYTQKAEEAISTGLRLARVRDSLWIASSEIEKWLGDQPSRITALQKAVGESATGTIARYLLARQYRAAGKPQEAIDTLQYILENNPDEYRAVLEYALALLDLGRPRKEAIAVLSLSTTYGLGDPRFIATYGGLLFLDESFTSADKIFQETTRRELSGSDTTAVHFKPLDQASRQPLRAVGSVLEVGARMSRISKQGWPPVVCASSKLNASSIRRGMKVNFELAFSAQGGVAANPQPA